MQSMINPKRNSTSAGIIRRRRGRCDGSASSGAPASPPPPLRRPHKRAPSAALQASRARRASHNAAATSSNKPSASAEVTDAGTITTGVTTSPDTTAMYSPNTRPHRNFTGATPSARHVTRARAPGARTHYGDGEGGNTNTNTNTKYTCDTGQTGRGRASKQVTRHPSRTPARIHTARSARLLLLPSQYARRQFPASRASRRSSPE